MSHRRKLPEPGDLVLGTITDIYDHGCYVRLDEYENLTAYVHISELSSTWVRNIRNVVREGKKVVGRVMRIRENQIDISLKRVSDGLRREKIVEYKHYQTSLALLKMAAEELDITIEEARSEVEDPCIDTYGGLYEALEESLFVGKNALTEAGVPEKWATVLTDLAQKNLTIPKVKIKQNLEIVCWESNGVEIIKKVLMEALKEREAIEAGESELGIQIYARGAPIYRLEISARDYSLAMDLSSRVSKTIEKELEPYNHSLKVTDIK